MTPNEYTDEAHAVLLSAASGPRLTRYARRLRDHLARLAARSAAPPLADIAYTLQTGRVAMANRLAVIAIDVPALLDGLDAYLAGRPHPAVATGVIDAGLPAVASLPDERSLRATETAAAAAWLDGYDVPWQQYWPPPASPAGQHRPPTRISLPTYPWDDGEPDEDGTASAAAAPPSARDGALRYLVGLYADISGIPASQLNLHVPLEQYGLSSLLITRLNARLEQDLGETDRTLFFAHPDLAGVADALALRQPQCWAEPAPPHPAPDPGALAAPSDRLPGDDGAIAVIGIAGRYPQAPDLRRLWENLVRGRDCVTRLPARRGGGGWPVEEIWGGFLDQVDQFDPLLFNITPRDAELMDPQERLFLEVSWEALEDAGYTRARLRARHGSRVAVYAGAMYNEYPYFGVERSLVGERQDCGATLGGVANRVSFFLDLRGPSMTVDTMCSSALTAIHLAVRTLRAGESEVALAGAVNLSLHPNKFVQQRRMRLTASDHRCHSFGAGGDGFVPSEGVGVVVLKPLGRAIADGDRIHAVIRGTAVVHAGRTNGYLVPNPEAQGEMVAQALRDAGVEPGSIGYLEAHGAGTALGDPVEINGLMRVFGAAGLPAGAIPIGSVKSSMGHVEAAAGMAGLAKVILQMRHGMLAPSLHAEGLNPNIDWDAVPFRVQRELAPWPADRRPLRAGISSFGAGGTIAHLVVEEAPARPETEPAAGGGGPHLVVLSAYDNERLRLVADRLVKFLRRPAESGRPPDLADVAYTLQVGREPLRERLAVAVHDLDELCAWLDRFVAGAAGGELACGRAPSAGYAAGPVLPATDAGPDLGALARHWVEGGQVDWDRLHASGRRPRIVALPSYPFARMRCWLPEPAASTPASAAPASAPPPAAPAAARDGAAEIPLYERSWAPAGLVGAPRTPDRPILCVFSSHSEPLARALVEQVGPDRVLLVREGGDLGDGISGYVSESDAVALAGAVLDRRPDLGGWLDLADLHRPDAERGLWRARLAMLQRVISLRASTGLRVLQVTRGLQDIDRWLDGRAGGGPPPSLAGARMAGFVRVLGAEYRRLTASVLDTDLAPGQTDQLAGHVLAEWGVSEPYGEVCHRQGRRYLPALRPIAAEYRLLRPDPDAAYVITGGTRGLGALVAKFLVERGARRLGVLGRRPLPADGNGSAPDAATAEAAATVRELRERGARVMVYSGPLTDCSQLSGFLDQVRAELGPIGGVVHCAGRFSQDRSGFAYQDLAEAQAVLEPKVDGLEVLIELTGADRPAFAVMFSSACAAVPSLAAGVTDYAAANGYLDFTVGHRIRTGQPWFRSISWPQWSQSGGGRGQPNPCEPVGMANLSDQAGLRVLERVLALPVGARVLPAPPLDGPVGVDALLGLRRGAPPEPAAAPAPATPQPPEPPVPAAQAAVPARPGGTTRPAGWLVDIFARTLHMPAADLDITAVFGDLGVESIMLGELLRAIEDRLGRSLEPATLLEHQTLQRLSAHLGVDEPVADPMPSTTRGPEASADNRIAVIGLVCRFPGAPDVDTFWSNLLGGRSAITEVPASRWDHRRFYRPTPQPGFSISKWGGFVDGIEEFDSAYFNLSDDEATCLDPAIRLFLEESASCLREAGYTDGELAGQDVGVFVGARMSDYGRRVGVRPGVLRSDQNFIAAHVAHHFDFRGPNLVVDSACSSSLVSVQLATRSLLAGESRLALAGGVEVLLDEQTYLDLSAARALSPSGRCSTFDQGADGFVPGEGCGVVLLKPLAAAIADGDRIHAVIEAVAVNNDGRTMGITTPNPAAQAQVVRQALVLSGRSPEEVGMVEAHGTGTLIGDPIELRALTEVFGTAAGRTGWCAIGSVKSNLGHLLSAAGIAGLAKVVLALEHGQIPATLFCDTPNPRFDFARSPFFPNTRLRPWPEGVQTRVAGLSSFGLGGTNAHLIASAPDTRWREGRPPPRQALPPPEFHRRRLWLDPPGRQVVATGGAEPLTASILDLQLIVGGQPARSPAGTPAG